MEGDFRSGSHSHFLRPVFASACSRGLQQGRDSGSCRGSKWLLKSSTLGTSPAHPHPGPARCSVTDGLQRTQWYKKVSHHCLSGESKAHSSLRACARVMSSIYNAHSLESHMAHTFLHSGPFRKASWVAPCPDQRFSLDSLLLYPDSLFLHYT